MRSAVLGGIGLALGAACSIRADFGPTQFACDEVERCPEGQACIEGLCRSDEPVDGAPVDPFLAPWQETTAIPEARDYNHQHAAVVNGYVYLIGGYGTEMTEVATVFYAPVNSDGTLGAWDWTTPLLGARALSDVVAKDGVLYVIGGADESTSNNTVYQAEVAGDGTIAEWTVTAALPMRLKAHGAVVAGDHVIVVGGGDESNQRRAEVYVARILDGGGLQPWQPTRSLPEPRAGAAVVYEGGFLYVIGGDDADEAVRATVYVAPVDAESGEVGAWSTGPALPEALRWATAAHDAGYIYLIGGSGASDSVQVFHARIESDGVTGEWELDAALPGPRRLHATAVVDGVFYVIGGGAGLEVLHADTPDP